MRIVGSSASLDLDNEKALSFIDGFFGVSNVKNNFNIIQAVPKYSDLELDKYFEKVKCEKLPSDLFDAYARNEVEDDEVHNFIKENKIQLNKHLSKVLRKTTLTSNEISEQLFDNNDDSIDPWLGIVKAS